MAAMMKHFKQAQQVLAFELEIKHLKRNSDLCQKLHNTKIIGVGTKVHNFRYIPG